MSELRKHTPGPWEYIKGNHQKFSRVKIGPYELQIDFCPKQSEEKANAKLISACPELLEALNKFCEACKKYNIEALTPEYEHAITIINKATS